MSWVDSAVQTAKRPVAAKDLSVDARFGADGAPENPFLRALQRDLARLNVRRIANRHDCEGTCGRPEHAADVAFAAEVLEMLGLTYESPAEPEPVERECSRCRDRKPISEFRHPIESRLTSQCAACRKKFYRPNSTKRRKEAVR